MTAARDCSTRAAFLSRPIGQSLSRYLDSRNPKNDPLRLRLRRDLAQAVAELHVATRDGMAPAEYWIGLLTIRTNEWMCNGMSDARDGALPNPCAVSALNGEITTAAFRHAETTVDHTTRHSAG